MIESKFNGEGGRPFFPYQLGPTQSSVTITSSCQVLPRQVLVTRAHAASERFLPFLRGTSAAGASEASCVGLSAAAPTGGACAALTVGPASGVLSATDNRAATSADIAVRITVITDMRPNIESRPNIFIGFLAKKRRVTNYTHLQILRGTNNGGYRPRAHCAVGRGLPHE